MEFQLGILAEMREAVACAEIVAADSPQLSNVLVPVLRRYSTSTDQYSRVLKGGWLRIPATEMRKAVVCRNSGSGLSATRKALLELPLAYLCQSCRRENPSKQCFAVYTTLSCPLYIDLPLGPT